jgi:hypothetical protein
MCGYDLYHLQPDTPVQAGPTVIDQDWQHRIKQAFSTPPQRALPGLVLLAVALACTLFGIWKISEFLSRSGNRLLYAGGASMLVGQTLFLVGLAHRKRLFWGQFALVALITAASSILAYTTRPTTNLDQSAAKICKQGQAARSNQANPSGQIRKIRIFFEEASRPLSKHDYPPGWQAESAADFQLVACVSESWLAIETCSFENNATLVREHQQVQVKLWQTSDLALIDSIELKGASPRPCLAEESFPVGEYYRTLRGDPVPINDIFLALDPWVKLKGQ